MASLLSAQGLQLNDPAMDSFFPVPSPPAPQRGRGKGARARTRFARRMRVWRLAVGCIGLLNGLDKGYPGSVTTSMPASGGCHLKAAWCVVARRLLCEAARHIRDCRSCASGLTGDPPASDVVGASDGLKFDPYTGAMKGRAARASLIADAIAEPDEQATTVDMLQALPAEEATFYEKEDNVALTTGWYAHRRATNIVKTRCRAVWLVSRG